MEKREPFDITFTSPKTVSKRGCPSCGHRTWAIQETLFRYGYDLLRIAPLVPIVDWPFSGCMVDKVQIDECQNCCAVIAG